MKKRKIKKFSLIIPVYFNEDNLRPLYYDLKEKVFDVIDYDYELIMVNDGSTDKSWQVMQELSSLDRNIKIFSLSRNFGSHAAILCGLNACTGDCAMVKAADLQEPSELIHSMVDKWAEGYNVVLATRERRNESKFKVAFANFYYWITRKAALPTMPKNGFDIYLLDRKPIDVLKNLDERNSALTGQILWSGFKTTNVPYERKDREIGRSRWTLKKKVRLVSDTLFSFSLLPTKLITGVGDNRFCRLRSLGNFNSCYKVERRNSRTRMDNINYCSVNKLWYHDDYYRDSWRVFMENL